MRVVGYFRVSDEEQVEGFSLDAQRRAFYEFCAQKGWEVVGSYDEEGHSAWLESSAKRPVFRRLLDDAQSDKFDVVATHTLDRFSRNLRVMLDAFHVLSQNNVTYVSMTQDIDYSTPEGKLFMTMLGAFAQYFSDALSGHTKKGMRERAMQGLFNGEPPFGYERCDAVCYGIDEGHTGCHVEWEKAQAVVEMFQRYANGVESMSTLAAWLNEQGFRTKSKKPQVIMGEVVEGDGRRFTNYSVRDMLKNRFYLGEVRHKEEHFAGRHQGLISEELFETVRERMAKNRSRRSVSGNVKSEHPHLLTGLLRCHECGTELWSQTQGAGGKTYYKSPDRGLSVICRHQGKAFVGWQIEEQVERLFEGFRLREDWIDWIIEHHVKGQDHSAAIQKRHAIQGQVDRARHLYFTGEIDWKIYTVTKNRAEAEMVGAHIPEIDEATDAGNQLAKFGAEWRSSCVSRRNRILRTFLEAVYVDLDQRVIVGVLPKPNYCRTMLAMAERNDVSLRSAKTGHLTGNGGDGGESHSPSRNSPERICYKLVRRFNLATADSRRRDSATASR